MVTLRYDPADAFELFGQKLGKTGLRTLHPDAVALGLVNTIVDRSARALNKVGVELDSIASRAFRARGVDQGARSRIYTETLDALGREDEKISNLRESLVEIERLLFPVVGRTLHGRAEARARGDEIGFARPPVARTGREL